jgi:hypothetical protein
MTLLYRGEPVRVISTRTYYKVVTAEGVTINGVSDFETEPAPPGYVVPSGSFEPRPAAPPQTRLSTHVRPT